MVMSASESAVISVTPNNPDELAVTLELAVMGGSAICAANGPAKATFITRPRSIDAGCPKRRALRQDYRDEGVVQQLLAG